MKHLITLLFLIIISLLSTNRALSQDNQKEITKNDCNIVLITIDTLRADHLSCYGYKRKTSPNIDKIAEKGIIFKNVIAPSSWTAPSMASLFTSVYPINHGVQQGSVTNKKVYHQEVFSDELVTLTEVLRNNGYTTFGVASNLHLSENFGFARGFNYFKCLPFLPAPAVNKTVSVWKEKIKQSDKFFLWVHYIDPHWPYTSRKPWVEKYFPEDQENDPNWLRKLPKLHAQTVSFLKKHPDSLPVLEALYDSEINFVDAYLGALFRTLELDSNTLIIITSDHGEEFLEHGQMGHGQNLHQESIQPPLIVKLPRNSKKEIVEEQYNLLDIMPTILSILDFNPPAQILGKSFWGKKRSLFGEKRGLLKKGRRHYDFSELDRHFIQKTILNQNWKYIYNYKTNQEYLYHIKSDPLELNNLANKRPKQYTALKEQLFNWVSNSKKYPPRKKTIQLSPQDKEKLKSMGYIQ
jgi:arylsulfatase A-like enzyme